MHTANAVSATFLGVSAITRAEEVPSICTQDVSYMVHATEYGYLQAVLLVG